MDKGAKIISSALLGYDGKAVIINSKAYVIHPPTIAKMAQAGYWLADLVGKEETQMIEQMRDGEIAAHALSAFIKGDDSLFEEFTQANIEEVVAALLVAWSLISTEPFMMLSVLARNVARLIAKPKQ